MHVPSSGMNDGQMMDEEPDKVRNTERQMSPRDVEKKNLVIKGMIYRHGTKQGVVKTSSSKFQGGKSYREKETCTKVKNRM